MVVVLSLGLGLGLGFRFVVIYLVDLVDFGMDFLLWFC